MPLPLLYLCNRVDTLDAKIDEKLLELDLGPDDDEGSLAKGQRGTLTRWRNEKATLVAEIELRHTAEQAEKKRQHEAEFERRLEMERQALSQCDNKASTVAGGDNNGATSELTGAIKAMNLDVRNQLSFSPTVDVASFTRSMQMAWSTHCKSNTREASDNSHTCLRW